ncbi:unnamed protein product [Peniophora sp. CBMAI 1063]|nr:unnamed protein product [Peniophora sp. CBMAI 1063]
MVYPYDPVREAQKMNTGRYLSTPEGRPYDLDSPSSSNTSLDALAGPYASEASYLQYAYNEWHEWHTTAETKHDTSRTLAHAPFHVAPHTLQTPPHYLPPLEDLTAALHYRSNAPAPHVNAEAGPSSQAGDTAVFTPTNLCASIPTPDPPQSKPGTDSPNDGYEVSEGFVCGDYVDINASRGDPLFSKLKNWEFSWGRLNYELEGRSDADQIISPMEVVMNEGSGKLAPLGALRRQPTLLSFFPTQSFPVPSRDMVHSASSSTIPLLPDPSSSFPSPSALPPLASPVACSHERILRSNVCDARSIPQDDEIWRKDGKRKRVISIQHASEDARPTKRARGTSAITLRIAPTPFGLHHKGKEAEDPAQPARTRAVSQQPLRLHLRIPPRPVCTPRGEKRNGLARRSDAPPINLAPAPRRRNLRPRKANFTYAGMC